MCFVCVLFGVGSVSEYAPLTWASSIFFLWRDKILALGLNMVYNLLRNDLDSRDIDKSWPLPACKGLEQKSKTVALPTVHVSMVLLSGISVLTVPQIQVLVGRNLSSRWLGLKRKCHGGMWYV